MDFNQQVESWGQAILNGVDATFVALQGTNPLYFIAIVAILVAIQLGRIVQEMRRHTERPGQTQQRLDELDAKVRSLSNEIANVKVAIPVGQAGVRSRDRDALRVYQSTRG